MHIIVWTIVWTIIVLVYLMTYAGGVSLFENISVLVEAVETIS